MPVPVTGCVGGPHHGVGTHGACIFNYIQPNYTLHDYIYSILSIHSPKVQNILNHHTSIPLLPCSGLPCGKWLKGRVDPSAEPWKKSAR